jgi:co-chaperonin GroES (HSP10)
MSKKDFLQATGNYVVMRDADISRSVSTGFGALQKSSSQVEDEGFSRGVIVDVSSEIDQSSISVDRRLCAGDEVYLRGKAGRHNRVKVSGVTYFVVSRTDIVCILRKG